MMKRQSQPRLPSNFSARLCLKELELRDHCSFQVITELVELYQVAIEYFEAKKDKRQEEFQYKLQCMLVRPEVIKHLDAVNKPSQRTLTQDSKSTPLISGADMNQENTDAVDVRSDIKQQVSTLETRLKLRMERCKSDWRSRLGEGRVWTGETEVTESSVEDAGELFGEEGLGEMEQVEAEFDAVMERYYEEKHKRLDEVRSKYTSQLSELESEIAASGGNSLLEQVAARLRLDMESELAQTNSEVIAMRKTQLKELKAKFLNSH